MKNKKSIGIIISFFILWAIENVYAQDSPRINMSPNGTYVDSLNGLGPAGKDDNLRKQMQNGNTDNSKPLLQPNGHGNTSQNKSSQGMVRPMRRDSSGLSTKKYTTNDSTYRGTSGVSTKNTKHLISKTRKDPQDKNMYLKRDSIINK